MEIQKVQCPACGNVVWDFEIIEYYLDDEVHFICPKCPENNK